MILSTLVSGCGDEGGVNLLATTPTAGVVGEPTPITGEPASVPATVESPDDGWPDRAYTPVAFAIALKSAQLVPQSDTAGTPRYTLFDTVNPNNPLVVTLRSDENTVVFENPATPPDGQYNLLELDVVYYEMVVPICDNQRCRNHRVRVYLQDASDPNTLGGTTVSKFDLLFSFSELSFDFGWISKVNGQFASTRPAENTYQIPNSPQNIRKATLSPPITIDDNEQAFEITLSFNLTDLFFYDETDPVAEASILADNFNLFSPHPTTQGTDPVAGISRDGTVRFACRLDDLSCTTPADAFPRVVGFDPTAVAVEK